jgi:hypothetical protein
MGYERGGHSLAKLGEERRRILDLELAMPGW